MSEKKYRLGIDIGGTFTDFTLVDISDGSAIGIKSSTHPDHPEEGIRKGIRILKKEYGMDPEKVEYFVHGMTIGLNTLLQRKGSKLALFVTEGFRDILNLQRLRLPVPFDIHSHLPEPLIPRHRVYGVKERLLADGSEYMPLDTESLKASCEDAIRKGVEGIAICFLHSHRNADHEKKAKEWIAGHFPELGVSISSELWPQIREYERACIAIINLYIQKNVKTYFSDLRRMLVEEGFQAEPFITQSNGGIMNIASAAASPIKTLFSGPAAGVIGAIRVCEPIGEKNLLTFDVGGTSTDVSIVVNGEPSFTQDSQMGGFPVNVPTIDIVSIGAGGGSIGWLDKGGLLKLGPESAGSSPGPACYGKSNYATLTDAFFVCGYLNADNFAAGRMALDVECSKKTIQVIADALHQNVTVTADQMIQVAVSNMYVELSNIMEQKGIDPRDFSVVAYGGGGPVTASFVAEEIKAKNVLVPYRPGTLCSLGALTADFAYDAVLSVQRIARLVDRNELREMLGQLQAEAKEWLKNQKALVLCDAPVNISYLADARYQGQSYEIQYSIDENSNLAELFHNRHESMYGHSEKDAEVEIINFRARIVAVTPKVPHISLAEGKSAPRAIDTRKVSIKGKEYQADIYARADLFAGDRISGPAVVEQEDTTVLILPDWTGRCDAYGNLILEKGDV